MTDKLPLVKSLDGCAELSETSLGTAYELKQAAALIRQQHEALVKARAILDEHCFSTHILAPLDAAIKAAEGKS